MEKLEDDLEEEQFLKKNGAGSKKHEAGLGADGEPSPAALKKWFIWAGLAILVCVLTAAAGSMISGSRNKRIAAVLEVVSVPAVRLELNRKGKILGVTGLNSEGWGVIKSLGLKNKNLEEGVTDLVSEMADRGYPDQSGIVVMTVRKSGDERGVRIERIAEEASVYAETALRKKQSGAVLYSSAADQKEAEGIAAEYVIPFSHAYLVKDLIDKNTKLKLEDIGRLARLDISDVGKEIEENNYKVSMKRVKIRESYRQKEKTRDPVMETPSEPAETETSESESGGEAEGESVQETKPEQVSPPKSSSRTKAPATEESSETATLPPAASETAPPPEETPETSNGPNISGPGGDGPTQPLETSMEDGPGAGITDAPETAAETKSGPGAGEQPVNPLGPGYGPAETEAQPDNYGPGAGGPGA